MNTASSDVADLNGVVLGEHAFDTEAPVFSVRELLVRDESSGQSSLSGEIRNGDGRRQSAASQEAGSAARYILSDLVLRSSGKNPQVVVKHVVAHAESTSNYGLWIQRVRKSE